MKVDLPYGVGYAFTQEVRYRLIGIAKYTVNIEGKTYTMYAIDPRHVQKYKRQFNIPDIVIQRAAKKEARYMS